ncbi:inner membrane protein YhjD [Nocardia cyriacigeorgica]|uniref:Inner membrane protein YhjD n=1 Tax=Nocardia cyriacigeorgica TaxID=135487 RepID=A0A6P1CNP2_9NOCA|nr:inner membrane protein YhjD [Nocardia cyriacigeorgica]MBF6425565.1 inner membrane protein YhjD [Nocardia cyriacigeorgica]NEW31795.1 inner membrane protein YhjD [Nocardia cyriacigeorgica]BDT85225.1 inner membrane protein YhjD [Nocardia cyriacigeorgica]
MQLIDNVKAAASRQVAARPWLDHLVRAGGRYQSQRGDYFAAGITYFTVLSLFPLLMVAFAAAGFVLAGNPELLDEIEQRVVENIPGELGTQLNDLIDQAIRSRTAVGVIGLLTGLYTGLGWMANLRAALTEQWEQKTDDGNWIVTKINDLGALIGLALAFVVSLGLSGLASSGLGAQLLDVAGLRDVPGARFVLWLLSTLLALLASWAVFAWMIARLPREKVTLASAAKAAALAAVAFEVFKMIASIYLQSVMSSPAGAAFGSVIGLMVFSYITYRIVLFATAWAATAAENEPEAEVPVPGPAVIRPRMQDGGRFGSGATYFGAGAVAALGLSLLRRRRQ